MFVMTMPHQENRVEVQRLSEFVASDPVVGRVVAASGGKPVFLVGGSVRDLLIGQEPAEFDFVIEGAVDEMARTLDPDARLHTEFGTAMVSVDGFPVDLAQARSETYPEPGALPVIAPADLRTDLGRRDFTINAMAFPVGRAGSLIDPYRGVEDLRRGVLRIIHGRSFVDDPTRAFRASRYCARLGLEVETDTLLALRMDTDISTVSEERISHELELIARDRDPTASLKFLSQWEVIEVDEGLLARSARAFGILDTETWSRLCSKEDLVLGILSEGMVDSVRALESEPEDRWEGFLALSEAAPAAVVLARAGGAEWIDVWPREWSDIDLRISGRDLTAAGVPEGPAVGLGLQAALRDRVLHGDRGPEAELSIALEEARRSERRLEET